MKRVPIAPISQRQRDRAAIAPKVRSYVRRGETRRQRICEMCGKTFVRWAGPREPSRFCTPSCWYQWQRDRRRRCTVCGAPVKPARRSQTTCSRLCGYKSRKLRTRPPTKCRWCSQDFFPTMQGINQAKFCSRACRTAFDRRRLTFVCSQCGCEFQRGAALIKRSARAFCGHRCAAIGNRGEGNPLFRGLRSGYRGAGWSELSELIRVRDDHSCRRCGARQETKRKFPVDHLIPWRTFEDKVAANDPSNLVTLCAPCHSWKTLTAERLYLKGDVVAFERFTRSISGKLQ